MKIAQMLRIADYSRISVGNRWMFATSKKKWIVFEEDKLSDNGQGKEVITTLSEDEAVYQLLLGEPLYSDVAKKARKDLK